MALKVKVSNMKCDDCASKISEAIKVMEPKAKVDVDLDSKTVTVDSGASDESIKQAIVAAGYHIEGYQ
ncbi:heavy-metal-associated domain-containing protein [Rivularia sp. UHCC 0363]|uniref:heavy-metal-associated domain-containing protein n=1 Tax=Rivularia sp. UHCC 0363 TaxID=3110244 RepID=UPI002B209681|nr:heavy-metal-associated domain-containing protein [Rivularia sp. UHCC 0363]MEA5594150.1 heavy-metal-associated domain-containing protein [Rivularia sp. UHCC 0363]